MTRTRPNPTRERLLRSAAEVMSRDGYARSSVKRISAGANVTTGAFYALFESKEQIARELVEREREHVPARAHEVRRRLGGAPPLDRLGALWYELVCLAIEDPIVSAAIRISIEVPEIAGSPVWQEWVPLLAGEASAAAAAGEVDEAVVPMLSVVLTCVCVGAWAMRPWTREFATAFASLTWAMVTLGVGQINPNQHVPRLCWMKDQPPPMPAPTLPPFPPMPPW
jgi:AcrR family transcriptional regulator